MGNMEKAGLQVLETDGINPWNSIRHYPNIILLAPLAWVLNRLPLLPRSLREQWGIDLIAVGIKK